MEKDKKTINRCSECGFYKTPQNHAIGIIKSLRKNAIHKWKNVLMRKNNLWLRRG